MELQLGKHYSLYTSKSAISGEKVLVVGIRAYSQIRDIPFDVNVLAIDEKVVFPEDDPIEGKFFYHCISMVDSKKHFLVWEDIIDASRTTILGAEYGYSLTISINPSSEANIAEIISRMETAIVAQYGSSVALNFAQSFVGQADEIAILYEKIRKYEGILEKFQVFDKYTTVLQKLAGTDMVAITDDIKSQLESIASAVDSIASVIG